MIASAEFLKTGDWVEVRSAEEIARTLDENGTLNGLPFMPEMLPYCGKRFQVSRRADKSCVELPGDVYQIRAFSHRDIILLEGIHCSGAEHGGCQRDCVIFWRESWLLKVDGDNASTDLTSTKDESLRCQLKTTSAPGLYFCQSTEMAKITRPQTRLGILLTCYRDVRSGSRSIPEMTRMVLGPLWRKLTKRFINRTLAGPQTKTPIGHLGLQAGEMVELKSEEEIRQTLDSKGRNRGLLVDRDAICKFSGGRYPVQTRIVRMIHEGTGKMRTLDNTVILEGINCTCQYVLGGCPRKEPTFWREIWLNRIESSAVSTKPNS